MNKFADSLNERIKSTGAVLCAGFDPTPAQIPSFLTGADRLLRFGELFLEGVHRSAACVKFNAAFFEAFGVDGLVALRSLTFAAKKVRLPVIIDAKRGDIGNTATAYANAWLGEDATCAPGDALTVNPYLGFDTLEPFVKRCEATGTGLFVLVRTSNPGAAEMQSEVSDRVAAWLANNAARLAGTSGFSGLGAVVGATAGDYQVKARALMPTTLFLVPGFGAQGASAKEAMAGLGAAGNGGVVNSSRGLLQGIERCVDGESVAKQITSNAEQARAELAVR
jgi:orotidine-5'-phosphate decarboxylase